LFGNNIKVAYLNGFSALQLALWSKAEKLQKFQGNYTYLEIERPHLIEIKGRLRDEVHEKLLRGLFS
jgi:hypothetical protein